MVDRLAFAAGSAVLDDRLPLDMPAGEAAMRGVLNALPALLREDSPVGEALRAWLGLQLETSLNNCRRCLHDPMRLAHDGDCVRDPNQRRLIGEWEDLPFGRLKITAVPKRVLPTTPVRNQIEETKP